MSPSQIVDGVLDRYASCKTYSDSGFVRFLDINKKPESILFRTKFIRPDRLKYEWQDYGPARGKSEEFSTLVANGDIATVHYTWDPNVEQTSCSRAVAGATGCSAGAASVIIPLLIAMESKTLLQLSQMKIGSEVLDDDDDSTQPSSQVIDGVWFNGDGITLWIGDSDFSVRSVRRSIPDWGEIHYYFKNIKFDHDTTSQFFNS